MAAKPIFTQNAGKLPIQETVTFIYLWPPYG
jgi:hypothetical protein